MLSAVADHLGGARRQGADCAVIDATHDSRTVEPGALFCALRGANVDGHEFAAAAVERGAAALLVERWVDVDRPQILVDDTRAAAGPAA
ncbi:MAG: Mur ligase domain-containing protein, partial [Nitriliruptoraceae bacterium]